MLLHNKRPYIVFYYWFFVLICHRWLDKLGMAAQNGVELVVRQTFYSSNYALVDYDMTPNPVRLYYFIQLKKTVIHLLGWSNDSLL